MRWLLILMVHCAPIEGEYRGTQSDTETSLALNADGSYSLSFATKSGPRLTLDGHYSAYDADSLQLMHRRLTVADGRDVVVSEHASDDALCAPLGSHELCVPQSQSLTVRFADDTLSIKDPPYAFMAKELTKN